MKYFKMTSIILLILVGIDIEQCIWWVEYISFSL
nr:MAG TPA: hypothetical protein [Caudoviricetes sp.]